MISSPSFEAAGAFRGLHTVKQNASREVAARRENFMLTMIQRVGLRTNRENLKPTFAGGLARAIWLVCALSLAVFSDAFAAASRSYSGEPVAPSIWRRTPGSSRGSHPISERQSAFSSFRA
jgi:hypothetical protein